MTFAKRFVFLCIAVLMLAACTNGGDPGPKKPAWANQMPEQPIN